MLSQLSLPVSLPDYETFDSFYVKGNESLLATILAFLAMDNFQSLFFWSAESTGKSHLLYASCQHITAQQQSATYIPLDHYRDLSVTMLEGIEQLDLVCLDNLHAIAGNLAWEEAIFDLFNRCQEQNHASLFISARATPNQLPLVLPDLLSRLSWGMVYQLHGLDDDDKVRALQQRAKLRGFTLSDDVGLFIIKHSPRDTKSLFALLNKLDHDSIAAQRKITIPFVKQSLNL